MQIAILILGGLSGPFSPLLAPIAWWDCLASRPERKTRLTQAILLTLTALVQLAFIFLQARALRSTMPLGANFVIFSTLMTRQVLLCGIIGVARITQVLNILPWMRSPLFAETGLIVSFSIGVYAFIRGPVVYKKFVVYSASILLTALISPEASGNIAQWVAMQVPSSGSRYYLLPILAWFATFLVLSARRNAAVVRVPARLLLAISLLESLSIGIIPPNWRHPIRPSQRDLHVLLQAR